MKCKNCGEGNPIIKKCCQYCGAVLEGYTINNVTGEYGYRGADGLFYKDEEEYLAKRNKKQREVAVDAFKELFDKYGVVDIHIDIEKQKMIFTFG